MEVHMYKRYVRGHTLHAMEKYKGKWKFAREQIDQTKPEVEKATLERELFTKGGNGKGLRNPT